MSLIHFLADDFSSPSGYTYTTTTTTTNGSMPLATFLIIVVLALGAAIFLYIIPMWKIFQKAGRPGWAAIVPVYNNWVLFEITVFRAGWRSSNWCPF